MCGGHLPDGILQQSTCLPAPETTAFEPLDFVASSCPCLTHYSLRETTGLLSLLEIFGLASGNVSDAWLRALGRLSMFLEFLFLIEIKNNKILMYEIVYKRDFTARMKRITFPVETVGNVTQFTFQPLACGLQTIRGGTQMGMVPELLNHDLEICTQVVLLTKNKTL